LDDTSSITGSVAPSTLSAQWYKTPRERLGLGGRISHSDILPWDERDEREDELADLEQDRPRSQRSTLFHSRTLSRGRALDLPEAPPRSPLLTDKFLVDVKTLPEELKGRSLLPMRSQSVRSMPDQRAPSSRNGLSSPTQESLANGGRKKDTKLPSFGELVTEYKSLANKWYSSSQYTEQDDSTRPSTGTASFRSGMLNDRVTQPPTPLPSPGVISNLAPASPSKETASSLRSSKTGGEKSSKDSKKSKGKEKKKKKPSLFSAMAAEYKSLANNWYTEAGDAGDEESRQRAVSRRSTPFL